MGPNIFDLLDIENLPKPEKAKLRAYFEQQRKVLARKSRAINTALKALMPEERMHATLTAEKKAVNEQNRIVSKSLKRVTSRTSEQEAGAPEQRVIKLPPRG